MVPKGNGLDTGIHISTESEIYGTQEKPAIHESTPESSLSCYTKRHCHPDELQENLDLEEEVEEEESLFKSPWTNRRHIYLCSFQTEI
ncbi:hypothetical protein CEXT_601291 [Caerostris extrusa]|uniref:Uncharacterized protein n=1 Tax=Caerostris extrusa TaxID=172846 RepID=A0AAV4RUD8_CAEEX|nr:hypothetical protein CEXT_601291 [Caerostris extrusa]